MIKGIVVTTIMVFSDAGRMVVAGFEVDSTAAVFSNAEETGALFAISS